MRRSRWASTRFAEKRYTFWETPDGTLVSMAGLNPMVAGMVRLHPVYTPAHLRSRGYAAAVTAEVSRAALAAGATEDRTHGHLAAPPSAHGWPSSATSQPRMSSIRPAPTR